MSGKNIIGGDPKNNSDATNAVKGVFWNNSHFSYQASIVIRSLALGKDWRFPAFVTTLQDQYRTNWASTEVYGRTDTIYTFKSTNRNISLGFVIVAFDLYQAFWNWINVNEMTQGLYPIYKGVDSEKVFASPPIFGIKFQNLLREVATGEVLNDFLYGVCTGGMTISPDVKNGFLFDQNMVREYWNDAEMANQYRKLKNNYGFGDKEPQSGLLILPKFYDVKFDLAVIHTVFRGNERGKQWERGGPMVAATEEDAKQMSQKTRTEVDKEVSEERRKNLSKKVAKMQEKKIINGGGKK